MACEKRKIIYRHPKGRFVVYEWAAYGTVFPSSAKIREAVLTPECDRRGLLRSQDRERPPMAYSVRHNAKPEPWQKGAPRVGAAERGEMVRLWRQGESVAAIAKSLGRTRNCVKHNLDKAFQQKEQA